MKIDVPPRQVSGPKTVTLSGKLLPFQGKEEGAQPCLLKVFGSTSTYLPCFDTPEQLRFVMEKVGIANFVIKKIDDGPEFLKSIPKDVKIAVNFHDTPEGKIRWTEIQR